MWYLVLFAASCEMWEELMVAGLAFAGGVADWWGD